MHTRITRFAASLLCSLVIATLTTGCTSGSGTAGSGKPKVVATTGIVGDLVRNVAGDKVELQELMGADIDPHLYDPKPSDSRAIATADIIFYNGHHLEGKMTSLLDNNPRAVAVAENVPTDRLLHDEGSHDPHVWFDVSLWLFALDAVEKELAERDAANADTYKKNAAAYRKELEELHKEAQTELASIPKEQRVLVTAHDAFRYFGRAYDIEVTGLQGVSTATQADLKQVEEVADLIVERKIKAVFVESSVPPEGINKIIELCGSKDWTVTRAAESLYSDAMGEPGSPGGTYPGMIRHNVKTIVKALK